MTRNSFMLGGAIVLSAAGGLSAQKAAEKTVTAPRFEVDMLWPKPMPNHWILGSVTGVAVDSRDHIFVLSIPDYFTVRTELGTGPNGPTGECCFAAPAVMEYDAAGNVVGHFGGAGNGYDWPTQAHGIAVDKDGNVWIGGTGGNDTRLLKFSRDGKFLAAIGQAAASGQPVSPTSPAAPDTAYTGASNRGAAPGRGAAGRGRGRGRGAAVPALPPNSASKEMFGGAANISFDAATNSAFIADGFRNHRVAVVDMSTGAITRFWGANGSAPSDEAGAANQFKAVTCSKVSNDGMVYVCDRNNDRVQVFKKDGSFVTEAKVAADTRGDGSVWDVAFSADAAQKYLYVADGMNMKVWILDRKTLKPLAAFGDGGRVPGEFYAVGSIATDSKGNIYTGETYEGKRVQKFVYRGIGSVPVNAGSVWPKVGAAK
jgi:hypothetical protein